MPIFLDRLRKGWNAFINNKDPSFDYGMGNENFTRPDRMRYTRGNERTIISSIYNRISVDAAAIAIKHIRTNDDGYFEEEIKSGIGNALSFEANIDQSGREFIRDLIESMFDEGDIAIVPIDTEMDPKTNAFTDIYTVRVGQIVGWYPQHVRVRVYNDRKGIKEELIYDKANVAIITNPFYPVMNEPNSTLKRLTRKLSILDVIDEESGRGKLDLIIQLPYVIKSEARKEQAEKRRKEIEVQLANSKYGIAYTDGTEHITQLNRSLENNILTQVQYLTDLLFSQLGISQEILNGTADEASMENYYSRTVEPILSAICDSCNRKFLSKTARTQHQKIEFFRDPFKLASLATIAQVADVFTRSEIMSSNEFRSKLCLRPSTNPRANEPLNTNMPQAYEQAPMQGGVQDAADLEGIDGNLDQLQSMLEAQ